MKNSIAFKFIAIVLASITLTVALASGIGILLVSRMGLYVKTPEEMRKEQEDQAMEFAAYHLAREYAGRRFIQGPDPFVDSFMGDYTDFYSGTYLMPDAFCYKITGASGEVLFSNYRAGAEYTTFSGDYVVPYPVYQGVYTDSGTWEADNYDWVTDSGLEPTAPEIFHEDQQPILPTSAAGEMREALSPANFREVYDQEREQFVTYGYDYADSPQLFVTLYVEPGAVIADNANSTYLAVLFYSYRYTLILTLVLGLLLFAACFVYLCCAAGRKPGSEEVRPAGLNCLPLDLYGGTAALLVVILISMVDNLFNKFDYQNENTFVLFIILLLGCILAGCLAAIGWLFALAAQTKERNGFWWKRSAIGWCLYKLWRCLRWVCRGVRKLFVLLPLIWQWLLIAAAMPVMVSLTYLLSRSFFGDYSPLPAFMTLGSVLLCVGIVSYGACAYGTVLAGAKRMAKGDLCSKIPTQYLIGSFAACANNLNALADVAVSAAQEQIKSERMKSELITNVSHDIKTPLTSIINYVDLLQKSHTPEEGQGYLEVLNRQSQRMKKLIEDLMEMSKASTGNIAVNIIKVDAVEAVNQALGEFSDKLAAVNLDPVFCQPEGPVPMFADGRLAWRVLSNLLSNAVKYALPGTRLYLDVVRLPGKVLISLKNISREQLNIASEELMERFVRGDSSRNTEGSGLGLNIAKSLMELQNGQLQLLVDGDLFKVTLIFPGA